jgi:hypothetical protein
MQFGETFPSLLQLEAPSKTFTELLSFVVGLLSACPDVFLRSVSDALPPGSYVPILSDIILPSVAMALVFILMRHLFDRYVNMTVL